MADLNAIHEKLYPFSEVKSLSMFDMLDYFIKRGTMRVSDLHLKVNAPPV